MTKKESIIKLEKLLEDRTSEEFLHLLINYMSGKDLEEFLEFVEKEYL